MENRINGDRPGLNRLFEFAGGSVPGMDHLGRGRIIRGINNQDAFSWQASDNLAAAIVCDGCGSGKYSECGARIGAILFMEAIRRNFNILARKYDQDNLPLHPQTFLEVLRMDVLSCFRALAGRMGDNMEETVHDYFLFTALVVLMTRRLTMVFSIGDGVFWINGTMIRIGPFPDNAPPYMNHALLNGGWNMRGFQPPLFRVEHTIRTADVRTILIGTDGVLDLAAAADRTLPGRNDLLGPIDSFWTDDRFFMNPDSIRRRLVLANSRAHVPGTSSMNVSTENGLLPDDTTLVVIRRVTEYHEADNGLCVKGRLP